MTRKIISNQLWTSLQPLLPPQQPSPRGGRPRLDDYAVLNGILFVLTTGIPWEDLEPLTKPFNKAQADNGTRQRQQGEMDIQPSLETNS